MRKEVHLKYRVVVLFYFCVSTLTGFLGNFKVPNPNQPGKTS